MFRRRENKRWRRREAGRHKESEQVSSGFRPLFPLIDFLCSFLLPTLLILTYSSSQLALIVSPSLLSSSLDFTQSLPRLSLHIFSLISSFQGSPFVFTLHCLFTVCPRILFSLSSCMSRAPFSPCSFPFLSIYSVPPLCICHTQIHLVLLFISQPINLMFPSSLLFSSHVFNLSLSLSSITHPHNYPAVAV